MKKIAFVCTGNTCRSPMAEALAKKIFAEYSLEAKVISRGIAVYFPSGANEKAVAAMQAYNIHIDGHQAQQISEEDINETELLLTMTKQHKQYLVQIDPTIKNRVFTIKEYLGENEQDIIDPFGESLETYRQCADELYRYIEELAKKLAGNP